MDNDYLLCLLCVVDIKNDGPVSVNYSSQDEVVSEMLLLCTLQHFILTKPILTGNFGD